MGELPPPIDHVDRFHTYRNCLNKMVTNVVERAKGSKSMTNGIQKWDRAGAPRVSNMEEFIHPQLQCVPCLESTGLSYPNHGTRKDLAL